MTINICPICGHLLFGDAPEKCPVCFTIKDKFKQSDNVFKESKEKSPEGAIKHVPVILISKDCKIIGGSCIDAAIKVGEATHPMEEAHSIQFIDCYVDDRYVTRIHLSPSVYAAGSVHLKVSGKTFKAVEFCNLHGYWQSEATI